MAARPPLEMLQQMFNEVLIQTGRAVKSSTRDGKLGNPQLAVTGNLKIAMSIDLFNGILNELECDILTSLEQKLRTKSVLLRDIKQVADKRKPPQPESKPIAPPAPMTIDLESPKMTMVSPALQNANRPLKQENKPVAPFPNMGLDLTVSPEVAPAPSPKALANTKTPKNSPRPATMAGAAGKISSATPKKDSKSSISRPVTVTPVPVPVIPTATQMKAAAAAQHAHAPTAMQSTTPIPVPAPIAAPAPAPAPAPTTIPASAPVPSSAPAPTSMTTAAPSLSSAPAEKIFTDMAFSLALPSSDGPTTSQAQSQDADLMSLGTSVANAASFNADSLAGGSNGNGPADVANMDLSGDHDGDTNMTSVDAKIDGLFDLGPGGLDNMDVDYDLGGGGDSSFNDMYFNDNSGSGEFDSTYFQL